METHVDLAAIEGALAQLRLSTDNAPDVNRSIVTLAAGSKANEEVRRRLADPKILPRLVEVVECSLNDSLEVTTDALRCIGNACIDNEAARSRIADLGVGWARQCLQQGDVELGWLAAQVLHNICFDYVPAQRACVVAKIHHDLISLCTLPGILKSADVSMILDLLFDLTGDGVLDAESVWRDVPHHIITGLLSLPHYHITHVSVDDFATIVEVCLTLLRVATVQTHIVANKLVDNVWRLFVDIERQLDGLAANDAMIAEQRELLQPLSSSVLWCSSDIAANPEFSVNYKRDDPFVEALIVLVAAVREADGLVSTAVSAHDTQVLPLFSEAFIEQGAPTSQVLSLGGWRELAAACQILGNWIWKVSVSEIEPLVLTRNVHMGLWSALRFRLISTDSPGSSMNDEIIHSIAGFLLQLCRGGAKVCEMMVEHVDANDALAALCHSQTPQLKQDGVRLMQALGKGSMSAREKLRDVISSLETPDETSNALQME
ncbi:hypothetical protein BAUCODRAFT_254436 [Baudoinia panamericana UAMH 10762]|uniref:Uncharacterized protein n=1 Tax=Baudoinia panamericana (strain UAMH 10762) TaxID=717646 RepID=M2LEY8_BAUPA|nr:uncharacterized protein BAUCODRAFT_254436 [Baudoinia panamericana UAMH 10762]EMC92582.1 hypothetical protein BAUCODRAFT_254436 [Baudoinia panamericana UAMH 10762]